MSSNQPTGGAVAALVQSLEGFGDLPHEITEGMDASACPFLTTAAELGLEGDQLYRVMQAMMAVLGPEEAGAPTEA